MFRPSPVDFVDNGVRVRVRSWTPRGRLGWLNSCRLGRPQA